MATESPVSPQCALLMNAVTNSYPNFNATATGFKPLYGQLMTDKYLGGQCGVDLDWIEQSNNTAYYLAANNETWDDGVKDEIYDLCILPKQPAAHLKAVLQFLAYFSTIIIMIGMGCSIDILQCWECLKKPWGVLVGVTCQFFIMPCIALGLGVAFTSSISSYQALVILLMGCSPGGSLSNIMTLWIEGDPSLSVTMTTTSTLLSLGMIPLLLLIMKPAIVDPETPLDIPFGGIALTLCVIILPTLAGMALGHFKKEWADKTAKICALLGVIAIIANLVLAFIMFPKAFSKAGWALWLIAALMPIMGAALGYGISVLVGKIPKLKEEGNFQSRQWRTVALETGAQNLRLANTIVQVSFIDCPSVIEEMIVFPLLYGIFQTCECLAVAGAWKLYFRYYPRELESNSYDVTKDSENQKDHDNKAFDNNE